MTYASAVTRLVTKSVPAGMTDDQLRRVAPSIFAETPWEGMSARYKPVPTISIVDMFRERGLIPTRASQSGSRTEGKGAFTKHMIRFRDENITDLSVGDEFPEIVLMNSHDGTSAYRVYAGVYRLVCANGMVVAQEQLGGTRMRHQGGDDFAEIVWDNTRQVIDQTPLVMSRIQEWKDITLNRQEQLALAHISLDAKLGNRPDTPKEDRKEATFHPAELLRGQRREDFQDAEGNRSLWNTFNTVQERMIRGGISGASYDPATGQSRRTKTKAVNSPTQDLSLNQALWAIFETYALIKTS